MILSLLDALCLFSHNNYCPNKIKHVEKNIFTIHGLWPDFKPPFPKKYERCNKGRDVIINNLNSYQQPKLFYNLEKYWVSNQYDNSAFWHYEYNKHGFCYTLKKSNQPTDFFEMVIENYLKKRLSHLLTKEVESLKVIDEDDLKYVR